MSIFSKPQKLFTSRLFLVIFFGFLLRIILFKFGTYNLDFYTFVAWSKDLVNFGIKHFYDHVWSDYLPGYLYVLYLLGRISGAVHIDILLLYKLPAIVADLLTGLLIYRIVEKVKGKRWATFSSFFYVFNPAIIANSTLWGQVDSLTALFSILSLYLLEINPLLSATALSLGAVVKPQASIVSLVLLFVMLKKKWSFKKIAAYVAEGAIFTILLFLPFNSDSNIFSFIVKRVGITLNQYTFTSVNAFNFWGLFGFWIKESQAFINQNLIGLIVFGLIFLFSAYKFINEKGKRYELTTILFAANFLFFTRMHERHLLPIFAPLAIISAFNPLLWWVYVGYSLTYLVNLRFAYDYAAKTVISYKTFIPLIILLNLVLFIFLLVVVLRRKKMTKSIFKDFYLFLKEKTRGVVFKLTPRTIKLVLLLIISFSLVTRLIFLNNPKDEYFDEVYHAFTARAMLHNDPKAWEWWNTAPEGFAYEWTHPPLAKEGMVLGMKIFGENSFGWRFPGAILGTLSILLVFLITKELFNDNFIALLASGALSLDGLFLVMSRVGMNDIYMVFFALLSLYFYVKNRNFFSALSFGLSLASKWSAVWMIPIIFLTHFVLKRKVKISYLWFLLLPPLFYLLSYIPMFTSGHTFNQFIEVQKQMWWYHTRLKATHPYQSSWWSWPFLIRPVWFYTSGLMKGVIGNIYAFGNPIIFWTGLISVFISGIFAFFEKNKKVGLIVFAYTIFFAPWALSPRIMFIYHYLPSIPFMAILIGYVLKKYQKLIVPFFAISLIAFLYLFPHLTGIKIPVDLDLSYYWFPSWR